jgi:hypothetical protein
MGGLLARALSVVEGSDGAPKITEDVRATVTLGSPFQGAVKTAVLLGTGRGTPVPAAPTGRMRKLAASLPGVYDLLPMYRCVEDDNQLVRFGADHAAWLGGDSTLAQAAIDFHQGLGDAPAVNHRALVGTGQHTLQSLRLDHGRMVPSYEDYLWEDGEPVRDDADVLVRQITSGDETVPRGSAALKGAERAYATQQHGALAKSSEALDYVVDVIREVEFGARQGGPEVGIRLPDMVRPEDELVVKIDGVSDVLGATCTITDAASGNLVEVARPQWRPDAIAARARLPQPGLYRVEVEASGSSPVSQLVLALSPED